MTLAARRGALPKNSGPVISEALERSAGGWVIQSVLSLLLERMNREAQQQKLRAHFVQAKQDVVRLQEIKGEGEGIRSVIRQSAMQEVSSTPETRSRLANLGRNRIKGFKSGGGRPRIWRRFSQSWSKPNSPDRNFNPMKVSTHG